MTLIYSQSPFLDSENIFTQNFNIRYKKKIDCFKVWTFCGFPKTFLNLISCPTSLCSSVVMYLLVQFVQSNWNMLLVGALRAFKEEGLMPGYYSVDVSNLTQSCAELIQPDACWLEILCDRSCRTSACLMTWKHCGSRRAAVLLLQLKQLLRTPSVWHNFALIGWNIWTSLRSVTHGSLLQRDTVDTIHWTSFVWQLIFFTWHQPSC